MIALPTDLVPGYETGIDTTRYSDWVEICALLNDDTVSKSDVRECFFEDNSYQIGEADLIVSNIWAELDRRNRLLDSAFPIEIKPNAVNACKSWHEIPGYVFCLILAYSKSKPDWEKHLCSDYTVHGQMFEELAASALRVKFAGWNVNVVGWSSENPSLLRNQIQGICGNLEEEAGSESPSTSDKDGGIDLMCHYPFSDGRGDQPVFFIQCATGRNWVTKRAVNTLNLWKNWINFKAPSLLSGGFAVPFLLDDDAFRQTQMRVDGLILDRVRLFKQSMPESEWLPAQLKERLLEWLDPRIPTLIDNN